MKTNRALKLGKALLLLSTLNLQLSTAFAQGTAFTYQGRLNDGANPATGNYDLRFTIYDAVTSGNVVGGPITNAPTVASNGLFTVTLDPGAGVFTGPARWLEIGARTNGSAGAYTVLAPRQPLTPAPYAIFANGASNLLGTLPAGQLSGTLSSGSLSGTYANPVTFNNAGNNFTGNGAGLANVNAATVGGLTAGNFWKTAGNGGTTAGVNFVGTTDNQPLELRANNQRVLRLEPNSSGVNVIGGSANNSVATFSATIGGGDFNQIQTNASYSTIGGGLGNQIQANAIFSMIGGGEDNTIQTNASRSTIGGGGFNQIQTCDYSAIGGGKYNTIGAYLSDATIAGGETNVIGTYCSDSAIGGGSSNIIENYARFATIPGGNQNVVAGNNSFAAGEKCSVQHDNCFMWSDGSFPFGTAGPNRFYALSVGGFYFYSGNGVGVQVAAGGNAWSAISDRNVKENFEPVDCKAMLEKVVALPVTTWNLKTQPPEIRHIGAMAQDFKAAFEVGEDDRHISTSDADGVALAAIQGLNQKLEEQRAENAELKKELGEIKQLLQKLSVKGNQP